MQNQSVLDEKNSAFWDELCGSSLARGLGITQITPETLVKFDKAYMDIYPYLPPYVTGENLEGKKVLEIGLGYGTLGQYIINRKCEYYGLDIAKAPVGMMINRMRFLGMPDRGRIMVGSALDIPFGNEEFDFVYSIGCLHHTGNLQKSINEVFRVLRLGGKAVIMLYNRRSFRQLVQVPYEKLKLDFRKQKSINFSERIRSLYDTNSVGESAPHTDYVSRLDVKRLFSNFIRVNTEIRNFDDYMLFNRYFLSRHLLLNNIGRILGLDLYITAQK